MSTQRAAIARLRSITSCQTKDTVTGFDIRLRRTPLNAAGGEGGPDSYTGRKKSNWKMANAAGASVQNPH